ncbi:MAG: YiiX/YebB-like N1pC/P60 family cysteine hydrolase [Archangium sp.]
MALLFRMLCLGALVGVAGEPQVVDFHDGDVVLQASKSERSALIRKASRSPYSHTGVIEVANDGVFVIEAVQPVSRTAFAKWAKRGEGGRVTVLRANDVDGAQVVRAAKTFLGKPYDAKYRWDDARIYCSELVVKSFEKVGVTVGKQEQVKDLALSPEELQLAASLGVMPEQTLVTPGSLADDVQFTVIVSNATIRTR